MVHRSAVLALSIIYVLSLVVLYRMMRSVRVQSGNPAPPSFSFHKSTEIPGTNSDTRRLGLVFKSESTAVLTENMALAEADEKYYYFLFHRHYICEDYVRLGDAVDGGWDVCVVGPYQLNKPCLVYSFGINYDFSFDDAVSIKYGCTVRAFDPSMWNVNDHRRGSNIWFYKIGLGGSDEVTKDGWTVKTLNSIVTQMNDNGKVIDYLKMDVDENEWSSLESMYKSDILTRVKQLAMEVHIMPTGTATTKAFYTRWKSLKRLEEFGFRRWYWHFNHYGAYKFENTTRSCCYELVYINVNFLQTISAPKSATPRIQ